MDHSIRILLADDHAILRDGLKALLNSEPGLSVVGEARDGLEAIDQFLELEPDVLVLDLVMPRLDGIQATLEIRRHFPQARILILTSFAEQQQVISAIRAGASGYLLKEAAAEELIDTIRNVYHNRPTFQTAVMRHLIDDIQTPPGSAHSSRQLTQREEDILRLVAEGFSNQEIADRLVLSERTVRTHITNILAKLQLENRTQAALYALREGIAHLKYNTQ